MMTAEDMNRNVFPELEGREVNDEIEIEGLDFFFMLFGIIHAILYLVFFCEIISRTSVFSLIKGDLIFNISEFGRLLYKVLDIYDYFL